MKEIYNLNQLVKVQIEGKQELNEYNYQKGFKLFGYTLQKEGWYFAGRLVYSGNEIDTHKSLVIIDDKLFRKPCVKLYFTNEYTTYIKYFANFGLANKYGHELASEHLTSKMEIKE